MYQTELMGAGCRGRVWGLIVSVPDHCLFFLLKLKYSDQVFVSNTYGAVTGISYF